MSRQAKLIREVLTLIKERTADLPPEEVIFIMQELTCEIALTWRQTRESYLNKRIHELANQIPKNIHGESSKNSAKEPTDVSET